MKKSTKQIKDILSLFPGPVLVITKNKGKLAELKKVGITGMHRNQIWHAPEQGRYNKPNLTGYSKDTVVIEIQGEKKNE